MDLNLDIDVTRSMISYVIGKLEDTTASTFDPEQIWEELVKDG